MIKLSNCKELNPFDHYEILNHLEDKKLNYILDKYHLTNDSTIELINRKYKDTIVIVHNSTKKPETIQISYFDKFGAYADKEVNNIKEAIRILMSCYNVKVVA